MWGKCNVPNSKKANDILAWISSDCHTVLRTGEATPEILC